MLSKLQVLAHQPRRLMRLSQRAAYIFGFPVLGVGLCVLIGWALGIPILTRILPGAITMKPLTAAGFLLASGALLCRSSVRLEQDSFSQRLAKRQRWLDRASVGLTLACLALGSLGLVEALFPIETGLGELLFQQDPNDIDAIARGRMAPNTALCFVLFSLSMISFNRRRYHLGQRLGLGIFYIAFLGLLGYVYSIELFYGVGSFTGMALHTSLNFICLAFALLLLYPEHGVMAICMADHAGGTLIRRVLFIILVGPVVTCGLVLAGVRQGFYGGDFGIALLCVLVIGLLSLLAWSSSNALGKADYYVSYDALTGLPNRRKFTQLLEVWKDYCRDHNQRLSILLLNVDRFKRLNEVLGYEVSNDVLVALSERLQAIAPPESVIARWGGDEFTILLPKIANREAGSRLAQQILDELTETFHIHTHQLRISTSLGLVTFPSDGHNVETLLQRADLALSKAKSQGRNNYQTYNHLLSEQAIGVLTLENALVTALEEEEFQLHYQPKLDLRTNQITGMEALLRWYSPTLGHIPPSQFIPLAEETGLIVSLGRWVLQQVMQQAQYWHQQELLTVPIAVNISAQQLHQAEFLQTLEQDLHYSALPSHLLELEITETTAMQDISYVQAQLYYIRDLGIKLSLDDFGTGFSSLAYLSHFPLQLLKIDRAFVTHLIRSPKSQALVQAMIDLSHGLGMRVLAEGVESQDQLDYLRLTSCDEIQGYVFERPMDTMKMTALLKRLARTYS
ncbi:MAG: bifunctional diguanylate cyclase/phosphodiesterase [Elainellaceae cyanobacterium]